MRLQSGAILHRALDAGRKRRHDALPLIVLQDLDLLLGDEAADVQIDDLAPLVADHPEFTTPGQGAPIQFQGLDCIRILHRLQRRADTAGLPTRLALALAATFLGAVFRIRSKTLSRDFDENELNSYILGKVKRSKYAGLRDVLGLAEMRKWSE